MSNNKSEKAPEYAWVLVEFDQARTPENMSSVISVYRTEASAKKAWQELTDEEHAEHIKYFIEEATLAVD